MGSAGARPELEALRELEEVLRHLEGELAGWRRRALAAEAKAAEVGRFLEEGGAGAHTRQLEERARQLEERVEQAKTRVAELLSRLAFLEQQSGNGGPDR
jgi:predicted RNase H-like nuclease (RuvC/YqgF family)